MVATLLVAAACDDAPPAGDPPPIAPPAATGAPAPGVPTDPGAPARQVEQAILEMVNAERGERGLPPVAWNEELAEQARAWSRDMAGRDVLEHQDLMQVIGQFDGLTAIGENVYRATGPVPAGRAHVGWMRSEGHRRNVLEPGFEMLGVGVHCAPDGGVWATQLFGREGAPPPPPADAPPLEPSSRSRRRARPADAPSERRRPRRPDQSERVSPARSA